LHAALAQLVLQLLDALPDAFRVGCAGREVQVVAVEAQRRRIGFTAC